MRLALAIACTVILIVHGIVFYDQFFYAWERYQTAYFDQARSLSKSDAERKALEKRKPGIEQILVTQFGEMRVDRCVTCHISMDDPRFKDHAHPLRSHPFSAALGDILHDGKWERRHKFSDFGCTVCHDGQGRGLTIYYGHGQDRFWPDPMLGYTTQAQWRAEFLPKLKGKEYMEANCAQCHTEQNFAGTPTINRGRQLYFTYSCYGCHRIAGLSDGTLGPDLTEVGKKFKVDYLWESIVDPRANIATSFMPKFNMSEADVLALTVFLKSRRGKNFTETSLQRYRAQLSGAHRAEPVPAGAKMAAAAPVSVSRGAQLVQERGCTACHKLGNQDGGIAPDLSYVGLMRSEEWLLDHFRNPRARISDSIMPAFRFPDEDFRSLAAYLLTLRTPPPAHAAAEMYRSLCARCHGEKGDANGPAAWYLDPAPRDFTKAAFMNSKTDERLLASIRNGVAGSSMPAWGRALTDDQMQALLDYVRITFVKEPRRESKPRQVPAQNPVPFTAESSARGQQLYLRRCTGCHGLKADGKGPNSLDITPRPRNLRNTAFFDSVSDSRLFESIEYGVQGTAMPPWMDYGLSQNDIGDLINFIRSINQKQARSPNAGSTSQ